MHARVPRRHPHSRRGGADARARPARGRGLLSPFPAGSSDTHTPGAQVPGRAVRAAHRTHAPSQGRRSHGRCHGIARDLGGGTPVRIVTGAFFFPSYTKLHVRCWANGCEWRKSKDAGDPEAAWSGVLLGASWGGRGEDTERPGKTRTPAFKPGPWSKPRRVIGHTVRKDTMQRKLIGATSASRRPRFTFSRIRIFKKSQAAAQGGCLCPLPVPSSAPPPPRLPHPTPATPSRLPITPPSARKPGCPGMEGVSTSAARDANTPGADLT